jgi:hypothetical protein
VLEEEEEISRNIVQRDRNIRDGAGEVRQLVGCSPCGGTDAVVGPAA